MKNNLIVVEVGDPVAEIEGQEDGGRDVEGADVDVVTHLGRLRRTGSLEDRKSRKFPAGLGLGPDPVLNVCWFFSDLLKFNFFS